MELRLAAAFCLRDKPPIKTLDTNTQRPRPGQHYLTYATTHCCGENEACIQIMHANVPPGQLEASRPLLDSVFWVFSGLKLFSHSATQQPQAWQLLLSFEVLLVCPRT